MTGAIWLLPAERFYMAPFRETQTAISARSIRTDGAAIMTYETPVLGAPWQIPFEFGLFQAITAAVPEWLCREDAAGRAVSAVFLLLCGGAVWLLSRELGLDKDVTCWAAGVFLLAPVHLAYGTAYMIESCALWFALLHIWGAARWLRTGSLLALLLCASAGVVAALVKGTTWVPAACMLIGLSLLAMTSRQQAVGNAGPWRHINLALAVLVALIAGITWLAYSDRVKSLNPLAAGIISGNIQAWNYGTLAQKLSPVVWAVIIGKELLLLFGPIVILAGAFVTRRFRPVLVDRRQGWLLVLLLAAFFSGPAVFTNLHLRHQYYLWANGIYLILAAGVLLSALPAGRLRTVFLWGVPISCALTAVSFIGLQRSLVNVREERLIAVLAGLPPRQPVAFAGFDWSPYVPYYAQRKAMFLPAARDRAAINQALELNRSLSYVAVVWNGPRNDETAIILRAGLLSHVGEPMEVWPGVWMVVRDGVKWTAPQADPSVVRLQKLQQIVPADSAKPNGVIFLQVRPGALWRSGEAFLRCGLRRGGDLFFFDSHDFRLWRYSGYFPAT